MRLARRWAAGVLFGGIWVASCSSDNGSGAVGSNGAAGSTNDAGDRGTAGANGTAGGGGTAGGAGGTTTASFDSGFASDGRADGDSFEGDASSVRDATMSVPSDSASDAPLGDATGSGDAGSCRTAMPPDPRASQRAACTFGAGAKTTDTLPITEMTRAALPIKNVIVLMKENRSFDHLLGQLHASGQPDVDAIPPSFANADNANAAVASFHLDTTCVKSDPGHQWDEMHAQVNAGAMDGFVKSAATTTGTDGHFAMGTYGPADLPFYYWLANTFAINDRHFASVRSGTHPNRDFLLLGTADGVKCTGCGFPNPTTPTLFDSLDAGHITWGAYADSALFDGALNWNFTHRGAHRMSDFRTALADGTLPQVSFVDGLPDVEDEHPTGDVQRGEAWTRDIYEAAVTSPLWPGLAIVWTYDEAGGFADHVAPPNQTCVARPGVASDQEFVEMGVRVPLAVMSPYARPHFVSHVIQEHTAITRFIELVFGLPALTSRDANSDALLDMFDFGCAPAFLHPPLAPAAGLAGCR